MLDATVVRTRSEAAATACKLGGVGFSANARIYMYTYIYIFDSYLLTAVKLTVTTPIAAIPRSLYSGAGAARPVTGAHASATAARGQNDAGKGN